MSPADGKPFCSIADASVGDVDKAVAAARRAFDNKGEVRNQTGPMLAQSHRAWTSTSTGGVVGELLFHAGTTVDLICDASWQLPPPPH